ncbi:MAG: hypothetical protein LC121_00880, partial [Anaerolineae bacterium]|nr:hypothetical protein [Anaerolineae bacterium]
AILPLIRQAEQTPIVTDSTATPLPTFPPPPADFNAITFDRVYLHPSGIFSIGQPDGWTASEPNKGATIAQINLINNDQLAVVDAYIEAPGVSLTPQELSDHFTESAISASWANFTTWQESSRDLVDERLVIDFTVTLQQRTYVARQTAWTDGTWIYVVRVLVPENATDYLRYLLDQFVASLKPQTEFQGTPLNWDAYYDPQASHIIRYPSTWTVTDSAPGRPTSISSNDGTLLRVESRGGVSITDEAAARSLVEGERSGISVVSVTPVQRGPGDQESHQGFSVAYSYTTVDGSKDSGLYVLLNSADGNLHVANLLFPASDVDLNAIPASAPAPEATAEAGADSADSTYQPLAQVMSTFFVIEPLNLSDQSMAATPTPLPTLAPTAIPTSEATLESTAEATPEAIPEATTEEAPAEATAEATAAS